MDPIAHTLAGATLSQTGLRKLTPLATATLLIGANLPDIDGLASLFGSDASLLYRRGLTHGVLAQVLLPLLLTAFICLYDRLIRLRRHPEKEAVRPLPILLLSVIGVLSHPFLDWLNTYGVRLLMPFSGRWFYGDTLFIVDAWMWLLMGVSVVLAYSQTRWSQFLWFVLGTGMTSLILSAAFVPDPAKIIWCLGLAVIILFRVRGLFKTRRNVLAVACLATFSIYLATLSWGNRRVHGRVEEWMVTIQGEPLLQTMIGPLPANPFYREVLAVSDRHYYGLRMSVFGKDIEERYLRVPLPAPDPIVARALGNPDIQGFVNWMRFPHFEVKELPEGYSVLIRDLRYVRPDQNEASGIGMAATFVPR